MYLLNKLEKCKMKNSLIGLFKLTDKEKIDFIEVLNKNMAYMDNLGFVIVEKKGDAIFIHYINSTNVKEFVAKLLLVIPSLRIAYYRKVKKSYYIINIFNNEYRRIK